MRYIANFARILVGIEFMFSGFVKVVDPYGTGLKLQEYFEVFAEDLPSLASFFEFFAHQSQLLSILFCAAEFILGAALLFAYKMPKTTWIVLLLMSFFTFLTFYSAYFNKVTDCGCFGDFLKLDPWHSFIKDVISIAVILVVFAYRHKFRESGFAVPAVAISAIVAFGVGLYAKRYLPLLDFLPYAKGLSIKEQSMPTGVKPDMQYVFLNKKTNEELKSKEYLMDTTTYKYLSAEILNEADLKPKITDYVVTDINGEDFTEASLEGQKMLVLIKHEDEVSENEIADLKTLQKELGDKVEFMTLTSLSLDEFSKFFTKNNLSGGLYNTDEKVLKTMARTNAVLMLLDNGTVKGKWSSHNIPDAEDILQVINQ